MNKEELQKQYIEVKELFDSLDNLYWNIEESDKYKAIDKKCSESIIKNRLGNSYYSEAQIIHVSNQAKEDYKKEIAEQYKDTFLLLKSINKQMYYGEE